MQDMISSARVAEANVSTRTAAMCLGPEAGGRFEIRELPRKEPAADTSGPRDENRACLNELTDRGARLLKLPNGETRGYLEDGDELILRARAAETDFVRSGLVSVVHASSLPILAKGLMLAGLVPRSPVSAMCGGGEKWRVIERTKPKRTSSICEALQMWPSLPSRAIYTTSTKKESPRYSTGA